LAAQSVEEDVTSRSTRNCKARFADWRVNRWDHLLCCCCRPQWQ